MQALKSIVHIFLCIVLVVLLFGHSIASTDYDKGIAIQKACGLSGVPCSNKTFESNQIQRFSDKVVRNDGELQLKIISGSPIILRNTMASSENRKTYWFLTYFQPGEVV
jgi:hypothetical protein